MQNKIGICDASGEASEKSVCGESPIQELGYKLFLSALDSTDMGVVRHWRNDYEIWKWCRQNDLISDWDQMQWFERQARDQSIKMYKISISRKDGGETKTTMVGVCGLTSIDLINRRAEFSLYIAPACHNQGFGKKAMTCLLNHGFSNLGLNVIWGEVFDENPALDLFLELGFRQEGLRQDAYFRDGKFIAAHLIAMRAEEWSYCKF